MSVDTFQGKENYRQIMAAVDLDADAYSEEFSTQGGLLHLYCSWTSNDTPTGILYLQETPDGGTTWYNVTIPSAAVHALSNATLASGAISITDGGYAVLHLADVPRLPLRLFYDRSSGGTTPDTMTVEKH